MIPHRHQWKPLLDQATAFYSKREGGEEFWFVGSVKRCQIPHCEAFLFVPRDEHLSAVEADEVKPIERKKEQAA